MKIASAVGVACLLVGCGGGDGGSQLPPAMQMNTGGGGGSKLPPITLPMDKDAAPAVDSAVPAVVDAAAPAVDAAAPILDGPPLASDVSLTPAPDAAAAAPLTLRWEWPVLDAFKQNGQPVFPTYLAHLMGQANVKHPVPLELACATVTNPRATAAVVRLELSFATYAAPANEMVTVMPGSSVRKCLLPSFDYGQLYALTSQRSGRIEATARDGVQGAPFLTTMNFLIAPVGDVSWAETKGATFADMDDLVAVLVTKGASVIDLVQRSATAFARWEPLGEMARGRMSKTSTVTLAAGEYVADEINALYDGQESVQWEIGGDAVTVYLLQDAQMAALRAGQPFQAVAMWPAGTASGQRGQLPRGRYFLVFANRNVLLSATFTEKRTALSYDIGDDALRATFLALRDRGIKYSNIPSTFFTAGSWQHIRRPVESWAAASANCIDGSLVFASVLELIGLDPVLILTSNHAFVGVKRPGDIIVPVETTSVGMMTVSYSAAVEDAKDKFVNARRTDQQFHVVDVPALRTRGILPLPQ